MWSRIEVAFRQSIIGRWFGTLQPNERTMVAALGAFLVIVLLYLVAWRPLSDWSEAANARYQRQVAVIDWMKLHEKEARIAGQHADESRESGSLLTTVANSA